MTSIETVRLRLRRTELSDAEPFKSILWDPEVVEKKQVTLTDDPGDIELARRKTASLNDHWDAHGYGLWTVVEKESGQVIGCVGLQFGRAGQPSNSPGSSTVHAGIGDTRPKRRTRRSSGHGATPRSITSSA